MSTRDDILEWAGQRRITDVRQALALAGATPDAAAWRRFASALTLWLGVVLLAASVVFFIAYALQMTLLAKSGVLAATGGVLIALWFGMRLLLPVHEAKETGHA
jgi:uncharacterized membrane protein